VVRASAQSLPLSTLSDAATGPGIAIDAVRLQRLVGGGGMVLTDDYAPVDRLTAPLFATRYP